MAPRGQATRRVDRGSIAATRPRGPRAPGAAYGTLSILLVILLAGLALTSRQPAPPTIAEFAPQAVERIAHTDETGGTGGDAAVREGPSAEIDPETGLPRGNAVDVARVRSCVGDPPRQIEDPQSPPCVPYWAGDNGGATSRGVTRDEIRIVYDGDTQNPVRYFEALGEFFNRRFELYGRKLRLLRATRPCTWDSTSSGEEARAVEAAQELKAFAVSGECVFQNDVYARHKLVFNNPQYGYATEQYLARWRPYLWQYDMGSDKEMHAYGRWMCDRLRGGSAVHAGTADLQVSERVFGLYFERMHGLDTEPDAVIRSFSNCGGRFAHSVRDVMSVAAKPTGEPEQHFANVVLQMRQAGVTTIAAIAHFNDMWRLMRAATQQGYQPEWLISSYGLMDSNFLYKTLPPDQTSHAFGLSFIPKSSSPENTPAVWATQEIDPSYRWWDDPGTWSDPNANSPIIVWLAREYRSLLLIASGIQLAGPNLTPETFEAGLQRARFPNPDHRIRAGRVGFRPGGYSMTKDAAEIWYSLTAASNWDSNYTRGAFCYVEHGVRRIDGWPPGDPFFTGECDSGAGPAQ